jgi:hypothetical protein
LCEATKESDKPVKFKPASSGHIILMNPYVTCEPNKLSSIIGESSYRRLQKKLSFESRFVIAFVSKYGLIAWIPHNFPVKVDGFQSFKVTAGNQIELRKSGRRLIKVGGL